ncbi:Protein of unknown function [Devosia enhydra]|uniref:DUF3995 domain-containing protein n=1 Tax=Devosia enhydra TaxID=665118 RepID=A0A1K2HXH5_9HYPH|nr:DUF3995 domain-containing protein [Devosia enhydra]SFZ82986.1 Protein of unknown function [Devosia enhydra]
MSMLLAALVFIPLLAVAMGYALWSVGATWPIRNQELLAKTVVGTPGITRMPSRWTSLLAAILTLGAGITALSLADHDSGGTWLTLLGIVCAAAFLARGWAGYRPEWRRRYSEMPFADLDRRVYSPGALAIGLGFVALVIMRLL